MIEVSEAERIILNSPYKAPTTSVPLQKAMGRILREEIFADTDFPPFDRVMMDGIAIAFSAWQKGINRFPIEGIQSAGSPRLSLTDPKKCIEVMTGAVLPLHTDTVIPYEDIVIDKQPGIATLRETAPEKGRNIHYKGTDKKSGDKLIAPGIKISAAEIALMASVGKTQVRVSQNPRIAIVSTGNELVDVHEKPLPHQIRRSNVYALQAEVNRLGLAADLYHIEDEREVLSRRLSEIFQEHDVLIMSGGVSMGKYDFVPEVLEGLGVEKHFHKVKQKPGKPFWFGTQRDEKVIFAFPGNPVSTFMCFHRYFIPWFYKAGLSDQSDREFAVLSEDFEFASSLTYFLQVKVTFQKDGYLEAAPVKGKGSGDHANLLAADGFLELSGERKFFKAGESFPLFRYRK